MVSTSQIEIEVSALKTNLDFIRSLVDTSVLISAVIKGNAYGHGTHVVLPILEDLGVNHFAVYSSSEAKTAYFAKLKKTTIMIMGFIYDHDYKWVIKKDIEFYVSGLNELNKAIETAKELNKKAIIHIDLETGMNRTGFTLSFKA